jgi:hypothetical protein
VEWREASSSSHSYLDTRLWSALPLTRGGGKPSIHVDDGVGCRIGLQVSGKRKILHLLGIESATNCRDCTISIVFCS